MTPPTPAVAYPRAVVVSSLWFVALMGVGLLTSLLPLPWSLVGLATSLGALVAAGCAMISMRRVATGGLWVLMIVGAMLAGSMLLNYASAILLYEALHEYEECTRDAITLTASRACETAFRDASDARLAEVEETLQRWFGGGAPEAG